jgi:hypothetical protein
MSEERTLSDFTSAQPTVEGSAPDGSGVGSGSDAGGNKRDPLASGPGVGHTIAGRDIATGAPGDITNAGHASGEPHKSRQDTKHTGAPDTGGTGVTGAGGSSAATRPNESQR